MSHRTRTAALIGAGLAAATFIVTASTPALAGTPHGPVAPQKASYALGDVPLFVRSADPAALTQEAQLTASGDTKDAAALANVLATPQAVWLTGGTPDQVRKTVQQTIAAATVQKTVPVFVAYDIPGRDCSEYSAGGAADTAAYEAWIGGVAAGIGNTKAVVLVEPDSVGLLPQTTCIDQDGLSPSVYPFTDAERFTELNAAVSALEAKPNTSVYLDGTNSAWLDVPTLSDRLIAAGVNRAQGFFLNVSNYQLTGNNVDFGTWVSDCIALRGQDASANCPSQYWNCGPDGTAIAGLLGAWNGVALSPYGAWSDTATDPALNTSGITAQYASALAAAGVQPAAHLVIDTSRNGTGPNPMTAYAAAPYDQSAATVGALAAANWCNAPGAGLGLAPTTDTGVALVDAYLWVKTPGESDGQCDAAGGARAWDYSAYTQPGWPTDAAGQSLFDPLWGQNDPAAGAWFPAQVLDLIKNAHPAL